MLLVSLTQVGFACYNDNDPPEFIILEDFFFLTKWGLFLTPVCLILGLFAKPSMSNVKNTKRCRVWKFWIFLYELLLLMELFISLFFWTVLYWILPYCTHSTGFGRIRCVKIIGDHVFPTLCLLVDYSYNA